MTKDKYSKKQVSDEKDNPGEKVPTGSEKQYERIQNIGSVITGSKNSKIYCLTIIGQIEGVDGNRRRPFNRSTFSGVY